MSDALDADAVLAAITAPARAQLASLLVAARSESTQADALAGTTPAQGCAVFLAKHQTGGHGRQGRAWVSAPAGGSLAMSVARRFRTPVSAQSGLSLVAGIAVAEALDAPEVGLKWPNDLVAGGRKLGGILVNLRLSPPDGCAAVIGIGLNLRIPDSLGAGIGQEWTDLARLGCAPSSSSLLVAALLNCLLPAFALFEAEGMPAFHARWQRLDSLAGRPVRIHDGPRVHEGVSAGITDEGALRLHGEGGERVFSGGEVSLRSA